MATMIRDEEASFVGRSAEMDLIGAAMGRSRPVTLTGPGGVGKTRLARRAASLAMPDGEDGLAWADLSPLRNPVLLSATVADALGLSDHTPRMPADAICAWVGSRRMLLVLDCCEHLLDECCNLTGNLLTACPRLRILATSRQPLRIKGERVVQIVRAHAASVDGADDPEDVLPVAFDPGEVDRAAGGVPEGTVVGGGADAPYLLRPCPMW